MSPDEVKAIVLTELEAIQVRCGKEWHPLSGNDVPKHKLPKFDSTVWPAATTRIGRALGIKIPADVHIFGGRKGAPLNTLDQIVSAICAHGASIANIAAE